MEFYAHHGRTDQFGSPELLAADGTPTPSGDWGFDGPRLHGVKGFHCTYGVSGHWNLWFHSDRAANEAHALTGWEKFDDAALTVTFSDDGTLLKLYNREFERYHYFGDWGIM